MTRLTLVSLVYVDAALRVPREGLGQLRPSPSPVYPYLTKSLVQCYALFLPLSEIAQEVIMALNAARW